MMNISSLKLTVWGALFVFVIGIMTGPEAEASDASNKCYFGASYAYTLLEDVSGVDSGTSFTGGYEDGFSLAGAFGCGLKDSEHIRAEIELGYTSTGYDFISGLGVTADVTGDIDVLSGTVGGYFDLPVTDTIKPYVGGGIGVIGYDIGATTVTLGSTQVTTSGANDSALTTFAEIGLGIGLSNTIVVAPNIRYSWFNTGDCGAGCTIDDDSAWLYKMTVRIGF